MSASFPTTRLRRLRYHPKVRELVREHHLCVKDLIYPLIIKHGNRANTPIKSMPGQFQLSLQHLAEEIKEIERLKIPAVLLFGIPECKDENGSDAYSDNGIVQQAIELIKKVAPDLLIITDICCCEYTDTGHCGIVDEKTGSKDVNNDRTLEVLQKQALAQAKAGTDMVAPSAMIDGMVAAIRKILDKHGYEHIPILSYTSKYASALYGPFREAAKTKPQFGDRSSQQIDPANSNQVIREAQLDVIEGADMLMVKPSVTYLDIVYRLKQNFPEMPLCAYHVSGEYAMIKAACDKGWVNEKALVLETMIALKRAGADFIITYFSKDIARWLNS